MSAGGCWRMLRLALVGAASCVGKSSAFVPAAGLGCKPRLTPSCVRKSSAFVPAAGLGCKPRLTPRMMSSAPHPLSVIKKVLVPLADGSEELESVTIIDTLVRAKLHVTVASCSPALQVTCSRGVKIVAEKPIGECVEDEWDMIVCPGGMPGAANLRDNEVLENMLKQQVTDGRYVAAICAAPAVILAHYDLLKGKSATCYPADKFVEMLGEHRSDKKVVVDGNLITSQGPGTSLEFALKLVEVLEGKEMADALKKEMLFVG